MPLSKAYRRNCEEMSITSAVATMARLQAQRRDAVNKRNLKRSAHYGEMINVLAEVNGIKLLKQWFPKPGYPENLLRDLL